MKNFPTPFGSESKFEFPEKLMGNGMANGISLPLDDIVKLHPRMQHEVSMSYLHCCHLPLDELRFE